MAKILKEIIIMLLVCLLTMLILAVVLYKYVPSKKIVPEITTYVASEEVRDLLEDDIDRRSDENKVVLTYEVTSSDLRGFQATKDYVPGKVNPFATYAKKTEEETEVGENEKDDSLTSSNTSNETNSTQNNTNTQRGESNIK